MQSQKQSANTSQKGLLTEFAEARFYDGWKERFNEENKRFITPQNRKVRRWSERAEQSRRVSVDSDRKAAMSVWAYVYRNVKYDLSKKWKRPKETINSGKGDCEDVTFLIASMLPNLGVERSAVVLGEVHFPDGNIEYHTWNVVDGMVVDATGSPDSSKKIKYVPEQSWDITV